jgi:argininosuccinate lyase
MNATNERTVQEPGADVGRDGCHWLSEQNRASAVALVEAGVIGPAIARTIADAIVTVDAILAKPGAQRTADYKSVEPLLIEAGGYDASSLHAGRSRVDLSATTRRLLQRDAALVALDELNRARRAMLDFAENNATGLVPIYTQGRQAAAVPLGHYLGAYTAALEREAQNLIDAYSVINQSPFGAATGATSSFPIDRTLLAQLLGFDHLVENSLDATQHSIISTGAKIVGATGSAALVVSTLAADLGTQYARTVPWLTIAEAEGLLTSRSSSMPHKVNPALLNQIRNAAGELLTTGISYLVRSHNTPHGLPDFKNDAPDSALQQMADMMGTLAIMFKSLQFDAAVALQEVEEEYSTTPELADALQRDAGVPFRVGHHFASDIVNYGKAAKLKPADFPFSQAQHIYAEVAAHAHIHPAELPLDEAEFRRCLSPARVAAAARGIGGPQPAEVQRMLERQRRQLAADERSVQSRRAALDAAATKLRAAFEKLRTAA